MMEGALYHSVVIKLNLKMTEGCSGKADNTLENNPAAWVQFLAAHD